MAELMPNSLLLGSFRRDTGHMHLAWELVSTGMGQGSVFLSAWRLTASGAREEGECRRLLRRETTLDYF